MIKKVPHRKGHDFKYSMDNKKLKNLGFNPDHSKIEDEIPKLCEWYKQNKDWWKTLKNGL